MRPLRNKIIIERHFREAVTEAGIVMANEQKLNQGTILELPENLAIGPVAEHHALLKGMTVFFEQAEDFHPSLGYKNLAIVHIDDVLGVIG